MLSCTTPLKTDLSFPRYFRDSPVRSGRKILHICHANSTNKPLTITLVTLTMTYILKITSLEVVAVGGIRVSQTHRYFYAPGLNDRGHIVFVLSVCLFVCLFFFSTLLPPGAYCSVSQTPLDFFFIKLHI